MQKTPNIQGSALSLMAVSAPHWIRSASTESATITSRTPFSLQNAIRLAVDKALKKEGALGTSNWSSRKGIDESVLLMEHWENEKEGLEKRMRDIQPDILFIGAMTPSFPGAIEVAKLAKDVLGEKVLTVIGGKHVNETFFSDKKDAKTIKHTKGSPLRLIQEGTIDPVFDLACAGRCEELILAIAEEVGQLLNQGKNTRGIYGSVDSWTQAVRGDWLAGWVDHASIQDRQSVGFPLKINQMPVPAKLFGIKGKFDVFGTEHTAHAFSETSSGCSFDCFFCSERSTINGRMQQPETASDRLLRQFKTIKEVALQEHGTDSVSVFLEDSTFLGLNKKPDQLLCLAELMKAEQFTIPFGGQFTVDLLLDPEIQEAVLALKEVGFTYIFAGMETEDEDIAKTMSKNTSKGLSWIERNEQAIAFLKKAGIKYGVAVLFGLGETQEKRLQQLDQLKAWQDTYQSPCVVSLNIAGIHPLQKQTGEEPNFAEWGTPADSPYLAIFQRIFGEASTKYLVKPELLPTLAELEEIEKRYKALQLEQEIRKAPNDQTHFERDFYFDEELYGKHLDGTFPATHLNSACMAAPFPDIRQRSTEIAAKENMLSVEEKRFIMQDARSKAAALAGIPDSMQSAVAFGRNTTEAASLAFWLSGIKPGEHALISDAENPSIKRIFEEHRDHGNPKREDGWSAWATHYAARGPRYTDMIPEKTGVASTVLKLVETPDATIETELQAQIQATTKVLIFSHVLRLTGRELPVHFICDIARKIKAEKNPNDPDLFILVDGAQALGNVPQVSVLDLGCDAYVATPHKTMRSEVLGILYFNPENPRIQKNLPHLQTLSPCNQQVILEGMFSEELGIQPNVPDSLSYADLAGFSAAVDTIQQYGMRNNDFSAINNHRGELKKYCIEQLLQIQAETGISIEIPDISTPTNFILSLQIPSRDGREIAQQLAKKGIFVSYIDGDETRALSKILRLSFQMDTTRKDIDHFITELRFLLSDQ
jgi:selenocysteine lyase/cysteine desulfurase/radical SAM superfamily enzyme YgiQ (UPF0313 family)